MLSIVADFLNNRFDMDARILTGIKLLIVEDDLSSRLYLNKILERTGATLFNAGDGQEAINIAKDNPDLNIILMDIQLPVLDGYSSAKKIREFRKEIIIIAQTAYGLSGDMEDIISSGFDDFIIKPIYSSALLEKLTSLLNKK